MIQIFKDSCNSKALCSAFRSRNLKTCIQLLKQVKFDLRETYLEAFRTLVVDAGVYSVWAYNMFRDYPCCANRLLYGILRNDGDLKAMSCQIVGQSPIFINLPIMQKMPLRQPHKLLKQVQTWNAVLIIKKLVEAVNRGY